MKKPFLALLLTLALCIGLAVPAFAEEVLRDPLPSLSFDLPDGCTSPAKTDTYQLRHFQTELADSYRYSFTYDEEPASEEITCTALPLGTGITINGTGGISALPGEPSANGKVLYSYNTYIHAYSDPDGDGIFDERIIYCDLAGTVDGSDTYTVVPASEKGPFTPPENDGWPRYAASIGTFDIGFRHHSFNDTSVMVTTSDILYELFGPNTLIQVEAELSGIAGSEREEVAWFLLTGEAAPPAITVTITDLDNYISKKAMEFTLRSITEQYFPDNRLAAIHTDFTRNEETETVELKDIPILTAKGFMNILGIKAVSDAQEPWARVNLSAWSDPDGDGVYDQHLFMFYWNTDSVSMVPLSSPGPFSFREIAYYESMPIYGRSINVTGEGELTAHPYSAGNTPSAFVLSGNYLTWLFGPDTLVRIQPVTAEKFENGSAVVTEGRSYYAYIPRDAVAVPPFRDLSSWCLEAVNWAVENGVTTGTSYERFSPDNACTQAMILTFLWRAAGEPETETPCPVTLPASLRYAEAALGWAAEKGMIDEALDPSGGCTRADAVRYIWTAFGQESAGANSFNDVEKDADYAAAVNWAVTNGITNGYDNGDGTFSFRPGKVCTRGEIAAFLHRAYVPEARLTTEQ